MRFDVAEITRRAALAGGVDERLLTGYPEILLDVGRTGRRLSRDELDGRRHQGVLAAELNVPLGTLVDLYLGTTRTVWDGLPGARSGRAHEIAAAILCAVNDAVVALAEGHGAAQRQAIRAEEAARREFIDDLLHGGDAGRLAAQAGRFGLQLAARHVVAVARDRAPFVDADDRTHRVASAVQSRLDGHPALITTKDGLLVCVVPEPHAASLGPHLQAALGHDRPGCVGVGRAHPGPGGVARSYDDARTSLELAQRLGLPARQLRDADLLVYQVLGRDRAALVELVDTVLTPLQRARGGPQPLLDTLTAYFSAGNAAAAARTLHLSVRALTYRLARVHRLTGYDPATPAERYTLETAVLGARLLGWPAQPLPPQ